MNLNFKKEIIEKGFCYLKEFQPSVKTEEVVRKIGKIEVLPGGSPIHRLVPIEKKQASPYSYSSLFGLGSFPLHTDLAHWHTPPRFILLRCLKGSPNVSTTIVDGMQILEKISDLQLARALVHSRKPINGKTPLLNFFEKGKILRWDEVGTYRASWAKNIT